MFLRALALIRLRREGVCVLSPHAKNVDGTANVSLELRRGCAMCDPFFWPRREGFARGFRSLFGVLAPIFLNYAPIFWFLRAFPRYAVSVVFVVLARFVEFSRRFF